MFSFTLLHLQSVPPPSICPDTEMLWINWDVQIRSVLNLPSVNGKRGENETGANISMYIILSTFLKTLANLEPSLNILCPNSKYCFSVQTQANTTHRKNKACIQIWKLWNILIMIYSNLLYCFSCFLLQWRITIYGGEVGSSPVLTMMRRSRSFCHHHELIRVWMKENISQGFIAKKHTHKKSKH